MKKDKLGDFLWVSFLIQFISFISSWSLIDKNESIASIFFVTLIALIPINIILFFVRLLKKIKNKFWGDKKKRISNDEQQKLENINSLIYQVASSISDNDKKVLEELSSYINNPKEYSLKNNDRFGNIFEYFRDEITNSWIIMICLLEEFGYCSRFDWKDDKEELVWKISQLKKKINFNFNLLKEKKNNGNYYLIEELCAIINSALKDNLQLIILDTKSDEYIVAIVEKEKVDFLLELTKNFEYSIQNPKN